MWDILLVFTAYFIGVTFGKSTVQPKDEIDLIHLSLTQSQEDSRLFEAKWLDAEQRAETWERRYNNLLSTTQTSFEE